MTPVKVRELLELIPDAMLDKIGKEMEVDKINQFLTGKTIFKVLLFTISQTTRISLRYIENIYNSVIFQQYHNDTNQIKGRHSSFADRLKKIKIEFFSSIFQHLVKTYHEKLPSKTANQIYRFDSTIISISGKLFDGLNCGGSNVHARRHFKVVIGQKGLIPSSIYFCNEKSEVNDDRALQRAIIEASISNDDIITFDRGIRSAKTFVEFSQLNKMFVSRIRADRYIQVLEDYKLLDITDENIIIS